MSTGAILAAIGAGSALALLTLVLFAGFQWGRSPVPRLESELEQSQSSVARLTASLERRAKDELERRNGADLDWKREEALRNAVGEGGLDIDSRTELLLRLFPPAPPPPPAAAKPGGPAHPAGGQGGVSA